MPLRVIGAGLPRTATSSLTEALEILLAGRICNMSAIPNHPFDLGDGWDSAIKGGTPDWDSLLTGYVGAVDWPSSAFWRELSEAYPDTPIILSVRERAQVWLDSLEATILPYARMAAAPDWDGRRHLVDLFERFVGGANWDDPATLKAAYERHNQAVRDSISRERLVEWQASQGWAPICRALGVAVPEIPFPWKNRRSEWS